MGGNLGFYLLRVPYSAPVEIAMDVMRHVPEVEVLCPPALRSERENRLTESLKHFTAERS